MRKKVIGYYFIIFFLLSCEDQGKIPDNIIPPDKMVNVLVDLHIGEAKIKTLSRSKLDSPFVYFMKIKQETYQNYDIDHARFDSSYNYYMSKRLEIMEDIYTRVVDSLSLREATGNTRPSVNTSQK